MNTLLLKRLGIALLTSALGGGAAVSGYGWRVEVTLNQNKDQAVQEYARLWEMARGDCPEAKP